MNQIAQIIIIMKKGLVFIAGIIVGCVLTVTVMFIIAKTYSSHNPDITEAKHPVPFTLSDRFEVLQVLEEGTLAQCIDAEDAKDGFALPSVSAPVVYIVAE